MNKLFSIFLFACCFMVSGQHNLAKEAFMSSQETFCEHKSPELKELHKEGLSAIYYRNYEDVYKIFREIIKAEDSNCDAYYYIGYTLRIEEKFEQALPYLHTADSLANGRHLNAKNVYAYSAMMMGNAVLAREKYEEVLALNPNLPETHLALAKTAIAIGDIPYGLEHINIQFQKFPASKRNPYTNFLNAELLHLNEEPEKALPYFKKSKSQYGNDDKFKIYYAYCLFKTAETNDNKRMKKQSEKIYKQIKNKNLIPEIIKETLVF